MIKEKDAGDEDKKTIKCISMVISTIIEVSKIVERLRDMALFIKQSGEGRSEKEISYGWLNSCTRRRWVSEIW